MTEKTVNQAIQDEAVRAALGHHQSGRLGEADALYRQILARDPTRSEAWHYFGVLANQLGRTDIACELIGRSVALEPACAEAQSNLSHALLAGARYAEAAAAAREALRLQPDFPEALNNLARALLGLGQFPEAIAACRRALQLRPNYADAQMNLGNALRAGGFPDEAIDVYRRLIAQAGPGASDAYNNLGVALMSLGKTAEATDAYREALRLDPNDAEIHNNLGDAFFQSDKVENALACFQRSLALDPTCAAALRNLANAYNDLGNTLLNRNRCEEAIGCYREAIRLKPEHVLAFSNLGSALRAAGRIDEAAEACRRALLLDPDFTGAHINLGNRLKDQGLLEAALNCFRRAITLDPSPADHSNLVYCIHFHSEYDATSILAEAREWERRHALPLRHCIRKHDNDPTADRRLRIGYVSPDFRDHVVGHNLLPLLREHNREDFEIFCYSDTLVPDSVTGEIRALADGWREIAGLADTRAEELIRADQIDILVDLALHTAHNRLLLFARRPAPVQATYLAYCSTSGLGEMDYRLSDPFLDPPETDLSCYSERTIRLPRSYWCYQPKGPTPEVSPLPARDTDKVTFGCLNNFAKVSERALELWMEILQATPRSRLLLQAPQGSSRQRVAETFANRGLASDRLEFAGTAPWPEYVQNWQRVDIGLDPFPFGGGITTCDALWLGVPVVSLSGRTAVGRGGRSILSNIGLAELVAHTPHEYVETAVSLAGDLPRLTELRCSLRERMERSPLRDAPGSARDLEAAYRRMWRARGQEETRTSSTLAT